jgi:multimeric flavodoxin WrbA
VYTISEYKKGDTNMKILGVSFSPRAKGNTVAMLSRALEAARREGAEADLYSVAGRNIQPCDGCWACMKTGRCHIKDDAPELFDKIMAADGLILGTPVYFWGMTAQAKAVIDRSIAFHGTEHNYNNKVCGAVTSCGSLGMGNVLKDLTYFIVQRRMLPANQVSAYLGSPEELEKMPKCLKALQNLGKQMVALAKMNFKYPAEFVGGPGAFGTHTK